MPNKSTIQDVKNAIAKGDIQDPVDVLTSIMSGQDPTCLSTVYRLANEINDFSVDGVTKEDWNELYDLIRRYCKYQSTTISESKDAAKVLMEYIYPKKKSIETFNTSADGSALSTRPLTDADIEKFKDRFNDEF